MKKFLKVLVLGVAMLGSTAGAQSLDNIIDGKIKASEARQRAYTDSVFKSVVISKPDTGTGNPDTRQPCAKIGRDPKIMAVSNIKSNSLTLQFDANNVSVLQYDIIGADGKALFSATREPNSPFVELSYPPQPNGTYTIKIRGYSCKSPDDSKPFEIKTDQGGGGPVIPTDPSDPTNPPPDQDSYPLVNLTKGFDAHLSLRFEDKDKDGARLMTDYGTETKPDNYIWRYLINGDIVDSETRLKNYVVAGNNPLRVLVGKLKKDYLSDGFNKWGTGNMSEYGYYDAAQGKWILNGWYKMDAGEPFSYNTSYAFQTFVAKGKQDAKGFLNHVPQNYDPTDQQVSWGDIGEELTLPKGKFWIADWKPWGVDRVFKLGVTHLPHHSLPWNDADGNQQVRALKAAGKTFSNYQRIEAVFGRPRDTSEGKKDQLWPNGTSKEYWPTPDGLPVDEARDWAWKTDASDALWISEMSENVSWQPNGAPMFGAFYPELRKRYDENFKAKGIDYEIAHNYFWLGGESLSRGHSADYFKKLFRTEPKDLPRSEFSPGGTLSATTLIVEGGYLNAPDAVMRKPIELVFRLEYFKQMGYHAGVVLFGQGETRPNNRYEIRFKDGKYLKVDKFPIDPNVHIAYAFFGLDNGNVFGEWGGMGKASQKLFDNRPGQGLSGDWFPNGSNEPRNNEFNKFWNGTGDIYHGFTGSQDLSYFGVRLYAKTFGQTYGGTRKMLRFRIDGGPWIQAADREIDGIIDAYDQSRGWVLSQSKDGKIAWYYHNSFADNKYHVLDVELPNGKIVSNKVAGNGIHAKIE